MDDVAVCVNVAEYQLGVLWLSNNVNLPFVLYGCNRLSYENIYQSISE
jgi:hypothetical protein